MNILYISYCTPYPPDKGEKIRAFHQIRYLSREHTIHLACLMNNSEDANHLKALEAYCASIDVAYRNPRIATVLSVLSVITGRPFSVGSFYSRVLKRKIDRRIRSTKFDRVFVVSSAMAQYVCGVSSIPKLMDFSDVDSELWSVVADYCRFPFSWMYRLESRRLARYEERIAGTFNHSILVSEAEARLLKPRVGGRPVSVVPNGVDLDYFVPITDDAQRSDLPVLLFTGSMDYFPNIDAVRYFCGEIFPRIQKQLPSTCFQIVGRNPTRAVKNLTLNPNVFVTGSVPDVRPYLARAAVMVAPFRIARGIQNKVLEGMAAGLPVVGTSTAFQGLEDAKSAGVHVADDAVEFARKVIALLKDPERYRQSALQARQYVQRYHQWQELGACLNSLLQS